MNRSEKAALQLRAVDVLRTLKETRTYEELADETGLPAGDLNRYVNGHVLPSETRARDIVDSAGRELLATELNARIAVDEEGYVDNTRVVFDQSLLSLVPPVAAEGLGIDPPDTVLTAATDGITLAAAMARYFGARCAYAKQSRETAVEEFIEARQRLASGIEIDYYLPESAIDAGDSVLVVDDLIRSGETQELLLDIAGSADADVIGVFALIAVGDEGIQRARRHTDAPVGALVERNG
ncbi:purine phosphoribosyltransferase (adenine phosphoribosyltransferase, xanthine-guanine phosphoribosyltransferase) [Natronomonas pharaonis DSM 2160]|uniref:Purine phosphoribosyltransferase (Adenine phosphoribosyltransferase, xanthine-guanine phosphoribosyltransferase) n=1 Tax=Natronomonas pharaonis (strain ATCC 35678 / DSM 2160 / CIP 103997 / JCM 8858 / NBRC 14720 / NCIMB 2260 / Gabara) TaxID=348780 RepID=A0A1U7EUR0_NATPD|nr:phosphoribosyltransferase family protein [Natronomonas pharaonis]CAI48718.1 purine phosphoribosyltransferase (adenine phosphoribosyltransferase, xanthine-guanine phosphoribosyltransferase) [Natronomonas pharaonis DSM 2160]